MLKETKELFKDVRFWLALGFIILLVQLVSAQITALAIAATFCVGISWLIAMVWPTSPKTSAKPVVKVWTRYGITAVCAQAEYDLWQQQHQRAVAIGIKRKSDRPAPRYAGYFTNDPHIKDSLHEFFTGDMREYNKIIAGCRVERSELSIPNNLIMQDCHANILIDMGCDSIEKIEDLYRLIHGVPAPEGLFDE